ncbi:MAG: hypothetical protein ACLUNZ_02125 [Evtepia sp.]
MDDGKGCARRPGAGGCRRRSWRPAAASPWPSACARRFAGRAADGNGICPPPAAGAKQVRRRRGSAKKATPEERGRGDLRQLSPLAILGALPPVRAAAAVPNAKVDEPRMNLA